MQRFTIASLQYKLNMVSLFIKDRAVSKNVTFLTQYIVLTNR